MKTMRLSGACLFLLLQACGASSAKLEATAPQNPVSAAAGSAESADGASAAGAMPQPSPESKEASAPAAAPNVASSPPSGGPVSEVTAENKVIEQARKMVDIEAHFTIEVRDVQKAARELRQLAETGGAQVTSENVNANAGNNRAEVALRVPATRAGAFFEALDSLGVMQNRQITSKDIGKQFFDATIRLGNLEVLRKRYEEILAQAKTVEEMLRLEGELSRIRGEIEQVKGELRWMQDRAARATVYVSLFTNVAAPAPAIIKPEAKVFPGIRASYLHDFRGQAGSAGYVGAGLDVGGAPQWFLEIQAFRAVDSDSAGLDGVFATINGRIYSEFLGNGERHYLNPFVGLRGGYARFLSKNEALVGASAGLEVLKGDWYLIDTEVRASALFGSSAGGHVGVEPSLGAIIAF